MIVAIFRLNLSPLEKRALYTCNYIRKIPEFKTETKLSIFSLVST